MKTGFPCRLVVDLPNWVGDHVMAQPAIRRLLDANSEGETTIHTRPSLQRFCRMIFPDARVVASPPKSMPIGGALRICGVGGRFDVGVTLRHAARAKILLWLAARHTLGSSGGSALLMIDQRYPVDRFRHQVFDAEPILLALGAEGIDPTWRPELPDELVEEGRLELVNAGLLGQRVVALAPGGAWGVSKRWPLERFGALAVRLHAAGVRPVVVIGSGEEDLAAAVRKAAGLDIPIVGLPLDVAGLVGVLAHLSALVGNDSGPAHLAAMVGIPTVTLFGPTDPSRTAPLGERHQVIRLKLDCAPCNEPQCPLGHDACMTELKVATVFDAVRQVVFSDQESNGYSEPISSECKPRTF